MGCGCGGGGIASSARVESFSRPVSQLIGECPYTLEMIQEWLEKANCFKRLGLYTLFPNLTLAKVNSYIGVLMSAVNYATNICYLQNKLDEVQSFITIVISTGSC